MYFPAFGVLFDTFRKAKTSLFFFFIMVLVLMTGFVFAAIMLFGLNELTYCNFASAATSLFRMLNGEFRYALLYKSNKSSALIFFFCYIVMFFLILQNLLLTIVVSVYDSLR